MLGKDGDNQVLELFTSEVVKFYKFLGRDQDKILIRWHFNFVKYLNMNCSKISLAPSTKNTR